MPASGGKLARGVAVEDAKAGENALRYPSFLPDGTHALFYSRNAKDRALAGALGRGDLHRCPQASDRGRLVVRGVRGARDTCSTGATATWSRTPSTRGDWSSLGDPKPVADDRGDDPGVYGAQRT